MSIIDVHFGDRRPIDWVCIALASTVLLVFFGIGLYGTSVGFLQTKAYFRANDIVSFGCAVIAAGCMLYLLLELTSERRGRVLLTLCVMGGMFGFWTVSKGVPAAVTMSAGRPARVAFTVARFEYGGRNCSNNLVATHPDYEDFVVCARTLPGPPPRVGQTVEVVGHLSGWGITREDVRVR